MFTTVKRSAFILLFLVLWLFGGIARPLDAHASIPKTPSIGVFCDGLSGRRFYDPTAGRFITADPLGFADGPNRYAYVGNRPLVFIDPDGRLAKGTGYGLKDLAVGTGQLFWNIGGSLGYGAVSIFDYELAEIIYGEQAHGLRNFGYGMGSLAWNVGGGIGYAVTWGIDPDYARDVYGEQTEGLQEAAISMSGGEGQSSYYRTGYVGSQIAAVYLLGKYGNKPVGENPLSSSTPETMVRVRHHTNPESLSRITDDAAINPSRAAQGLPPGVDVEVQPFGKASTAAKEMGAAHSGAYVEFEVPRFSLSPTPDVSAIRNTARIVSDTPVSLKGYNPSYVTRRWWQFWGD